MPKREVLVKALQDKLLLKLRALDMTGIFSSSRKIRLSYLVKKVVKSYSNVFIT